MLYDNIYKSLKIRFKKHVPMFPSVGKKNVTAQAIENHNVL